VHKNCLKTSEEEYKQLQASDKPWFCPTCKDETERTSYRCRINFSSEYSDGNETESISKTNPLTPPKNQNTQRRFTGLTPASFNSTPPKQNNKHVESSNNKDWNDSLYNMSPLYSTSSKYRDTRRGRASQGSLKYHTNSSIPKLQELLDQIASDLPSPPNQQYFDLIPTLNAETSSNEPPISPFLADKEQFGSPMKTTTVAPEPPQAFTAQLIRESDQPPDPEMEEGEPRVWDSINTTSEQILLPQSSLIMKGTIPYHYYFRRSFSPSSR